MLPEFILNLAKEVDGKNDSQDVHVFSLSSCQWCKKAKRWLDERGIKYRYVDVDKIEFSEKSQILQFLRETFKPERISYPFIVCDDKFVVGYNPRKFEELIKLGGN